MQDIVNKTPRKLALILALTFAATDFFGFSAVAAEPQEAASAPALPGYARVADLVTSSPAIAVVGVRKLTSISPERAPGLAPGEMRVLVAAQTISLIRSKDVIARDVSFLIDMPATPKNKPPKWKGRNFIIFGDVQQRVDFFQLRSSDSLLNWTPETEAMVRRVSAELSASDAPPLIEGVDSVFHVAGAVEGEGETQVFLTTGDGSPISLSIIRRPDEDPQFGVSLGEIVDDAAAMPPPASALWYRLACSLPAALPAKAMEGQAPGNAAAANRDYRAFMAALAPCDRAPQPLD